MPQPTSRLHGYNILSTLFLLFIALISSAQAVKEDNIDKVYRSCIGQDTSVSNISNCAFVAYGKWNTEMENGYKSVLKALKKEDAREQLKLSQTAWIAYRDAAFKAEDLMFNSPSAKSCMARHDDRINIVRTRAMQMRKYSESLKKIKR